MFTAAHLDLVEVLSCVKGHHIVGGDSDDGFICGVLGSVEGQRCLTWNHLRTERVCEEEEDEEDEEEVKIGA